MRARSVEAAFVRRSRVLQLLTAAAFGVVLLRTAQLQIVQHERLSRLAREQTLNTVRVPARRGDIVDRDGNALAISVDVPSAFANPSSVADPPRAARLLSRALEVDRQVLLERLQSGRYFVWLRRQLTAKLARRVAALNLAGVGLTDEPRRFYPQGATGAHVIGLAGVDGIGLEGLERQLDAELLGAPQRVPALRDARGRAVLAGSPDPAGRARGSDVRLALDLQLQHAAQAAVDRARDSSRARAAMAVVLDVATADVLAMAVSPGFDANHGAAASAALRRNRLVVDQFEPGSTLKPYVVAAALDVGAIAPSTIFFGEHGRLAVGGHTISDTSVHGWLGLTEVVARSSNIGMAKIGHALGAARLEAALRQARLGHRSGIELPGEAPGSLRRAAAWSDLDTATIAFGQGLAVNGVQLAALYRVLAAEGVYRAPRLVHAVARGDGTSVAATRPPDVPLLRPATTRRVTAMLEAATQPGEGTGRLAQIPGYRVAGKTGTAQKADPVAGGYSRDRFVALFAGYLPLPAPQAVIVVAVDEPQTSHYGGIVAAPAFAEIGRAVLQRRGIPPGPSPQLQAGARPEAPPDVVAAADEPRAVDVDAPAPGRLPSFVGLSGRQAAARMARAGLPYDLQVRGSGRVVAQEPAAGSRRLARGSLRLTLAP